MELRMTVKIAAITLGAAFLACCGGAPPVPIQTATQYKVVSEKPDASSSGVVTITIEVPAAADREQIKADVEAVISARKDRFNVITVRSFLEGSGPAGAPLAVSRFEGGRVEHVFDAAAMPGSQKIPTH
jgi:hypothetical protein